jgi:hypothetical protein
MIREFALLDLDKNSNNWTNLSVYLKALVEQKKPTNQV